MPDQISPSRLSGLFEDKAMHAKFEEAWTEREEAQPAVRGAFTNPPALRALRKVCRKLKVIMQAAEDRYLEVYACELEDM